jgi:2'-5' RNA ligase
MRLFTAIDLPAEVLQRLERLLSTLRPEALINWSPLDNLHITTKFIGEWPPARLDELHAALASLPVRRPFNVELKDLGWFPNERTPHALYAGVHGGQPLLDLAQDIEDSLISLGIRKEDRLFTPHLTLARIKSAVPLQRLQRKVQELQPASLGTFRVSSFALFRSDPGSNASLYRALQVYQFESAVAAS